MALDPKWIQTVDDGVTNAAWDAYDVTIKAEVGAYNQRFALDAQKTGYHVVDWKLCKAMVWVESGGPKSPAWKGRAIQIGDPGDPAINVLRRGAEGSALIMSSQLQLDLKTGKIDEPVLNIRLGIAYLFTRMAKFAIQSITDLRDSSKTYMYTVMPGDTLEGIAARQGTTVDNLNTSNPGMGSIIHPRDVLKYQKASMQRVIMGWIQFTTGNIASRYNAAGDPSYAAKLDYVLGLFGRLQRPAEPLNFPLTQPLTSDPVSTKP